MGHRPYVPRLGDFTPFRLCHINLFVVTAHRSSDRPGKESILLATAQIGDGPAEGSVSVKSWRYPGRAQLIPSEREKG